MSDSFRINDPQAYRRGDELEVLQEFAPPSGLQVLELGCGAAWMTRQVATRLGAARVTATEVDTIQHAKNLAIEDLPNVCFRLGGAELIADADGRYDLVLMLKSLHHVPVDLMDRALSEIHRALVPGGLLYVSEPVYWGAFNEVMRLIHDELGVRTAAFEALRRAVEAGLFRHEREVFYEAEGIYPDWEGFARRFIQVTHRPHDLDDAAIARVRAAFERHLTPEGARFLKPHRVDLLRRLP
jgi:SAM-dependent methyltransferase